MARDFASLAALVSSGHRYGATDDAASGRSSDSSQSRRLLPHESLSFYVFKAPLTIPANGPIVSLFEQRSCRTALKLAAFDGRREYLTAYCRDAERTYQGRWIPPTWCLTSPTSERTLPVYSRTTNPIVESRTINIKEPPFNTTVKSRVRTAGTSRDR